MAHNKRSSVDAIFVHMTFLLSLLSVFNASISTETDISCLKSIKASFEDPFGYLNASWDFSNNTEGYICRFTGVDCWHPEENRVLNLRLSDMGLKGQLPRGLKNCTSLSGLDLSNNEITGSIPFDIQLIVPFVTSLVLSSNNLSGEIPVGIASLTYLNILQLDHNRLTGQIPPQIGHLNRIKVFTVANNLLSGPVPNFINGTFSSDSYDNNAGLCGKPLESCKEHSTKPHLSFKDGFVIGYSVSVVIIVVVYGSYCVPWIHVGKRNKMITVTSMLMLMLRRSLKKKRKTEANLLGGLSTMEFLLETQISTSENFVTRMSYKDLRNATDNFGQHNIIGLGQMGTTYMASLSNGWSLAVKKLSNSAQSEEHFVTELKILGRLRHDNLVPLIGFCKESKKRLLVYKYLSNGNLFDWLYPVEGKKNKSVLEWPLRMKIATGLAKGLAWLHHCCDVRVAHLSINSKCVLLDQNFEPKLSNFGMATFINPKEINSCSRGFCMDIEFWEECFLKEDVFNFGIVLLELITGRVMATNSLNGSNGFFEKLISDFSSSSSHHPCDAIDEALKGQGHENEIFECLRVACHCIQSLHEKRPSMLEVYTKICIIRDK